MFIVTFPLLFIWVPFIEYSVNESAYGTAGAWCWIKSWIEQFGIFFAPAATLSLTDSISIVAIFSHMSCYQPVMFTVIQNTRSLIKK